MPDRAEVQAYTPAKEVNTDYSARNFETEFTINGY